MHTLILILLLTNSPGVRAQNQTQSPLPNQTKATEKSFASAVATAKRQLDASLVELDELRQHIADEKIPLSRKLRALERDLAEARLEYQDVSRLLDSSTLNLSNLRTETRSRREEASYLSNLLGEYTRNFETSLHIAEIQHHREALENAKLAPENHALSEQEMHQMQAELVTASLDRLHGALGGTRFEGTAVDTNGIVKPGTFALVGPAALFRSNDGQRIGTVEQRLGSFEPAVIDFATADDVEAAAQVLTTATGRFPLDPTLGNAHKIESTRETLWEHVQKGGPVMVPISVLAGASLLAALYKVLGLFFLSKPSREHMRALLDAVTQRDEAAARRAVRRIRGPVGAMLATGVEHLGEPRELIEEVMYEQALSTRLDLQRMLPFIAVSASAAPLLGLLGTVTGIINTFKLITVFGTGDVKTLSSGISEALITTEFGLIVAIPALLLHAFLSRRARGMIDQMEKAAIAFVNQISKARQERVHNTAMSDVTVASPEPASAAPDGVDISAAHPVDEPPDGKVATKTDQSRPATQAVWTESAEPEIRPGIG